MKITFLGVSSLLGGGYSSNILLDLGISGTLLIDCGFDIKYSLKNSKRTVEDVKNIYISHLHGDHCLGLEYIGFYNKFILNRKISLYIHESYVNDLWEMLKPSMGKLDDGEKNLSDYFYVRPLENYNSFMVGQHTFKIVKNKHISFDGKYNIFSYGLLWSRRGSYELDKESPDIENIYISTDTINPLLCKKWPEDILNRVSTCDLFFHEVDFDGNANHSPYDDLKALPDYIKSKIWLYHYSIDKDIYFNKVKEDGFAGLVKEGQIFEF